MGNSNTKEAARPSDAALPRGHRSSLAPSFDTATSPSSHQPDRPSSRRNRVSRSDFGGILGIGASGSGHHDQPHERRETKQEREAKRLERERVARIKERERSIKEEHVDGGFLVTLGTYTGPEDFSKQVVRQLQIERKIAPFWRGLNDFNDQWAEHQIVAAARGLPVPPADQTPPEELVPRPLPTDSPSTSTPNLNLTVPIGGRSLSIQSEQSATNTNSALPSPVSPGPGRTGSPFKPRTKALAAALNISSRNNSSSDIVPREINLPNDPFVNGQPIEVFLYKDASECPICFLYYPPYLNHTRCCDQAICSECFVQIKRPDPHYPEGHGENDPNPNPEGTPGVLISEPACCPYCQQPDFGVTYEAPPFRRGLTYTISPSTLGAMNTAMSSDSSLNSTLSPTIGSPPGGGLAIPSSRRRTQSVSANAPNVILTDRVRPDWSTKLNAARAHQARRAAAATALHTAAFLMGNPDSRAFRVARFSRRNTGNNSGGDGENTADSGAATPSQSGLEGPRTSSARGVMMPIGAGATSSRRSRMEDLEDMMFMEAIRLSLAAEEERKRKQEKEERKEAKRREKEERKAAKAALKFSSGSPADPYDVATHSSASGSSLSLPGLGRRRGNSGASNLRVEASLANAMTATVGGSAPVTPGASDTIDKGKAVDRGPTSQPEIINNNSSSDQQPSPISTAPAATSLPRPIPSPHQPIGPSHLRQMSSASSVSSSLGPDSAAGSYTGHHHSQPYPPNDPRASGLSLGSRSAASEDGGDHDRDRDPSASTEPMFNFSSLAEMVGVQMEGEHAGRRLSVVEAEQAELARQAAEAVSTSSPQEEGHRDGVDVKTDASASPPRADEAEGDIFEQQLEDMEDVSESTLADVEQSVVTLTPDNVNADAKNSCVDDKLHRHLEADLDDEERTRLQSNENPMTPPKLMITPETPAPVEGDADDSKQLGFNPEIVEHPQQVAQ